MKKIITFLTILYTTISFPTVIQVCNNADIPISVDIDRGSNCIKYGPRPSGSVNSGGGCDEWDIRDCDSDIKISFINGIYVPASTSNDNAYYTFTAGKDLAGYYVDQLTYKNKGENSQFLRIRAQK